MEKTEGEGSKAVSDDLLLLLPRGSDLVDLESDLAQGGGVEDESTIELETRFVDERNHVRGQTQAKPSEVQGPKQSTHDKCRLGHLLVDDVPVHLLELVPLGRDDDGSSSLASLDGVLGDSDLLLVRNGVSAALGEVHPHLVGLDLGVVNRYVGRLVEEVVDEGDGGGLSGVSSVLLEGETEDGDLLVGDGREEGLDDVARESLLLVLVHLDDAHPVASDLGKVERLGEVDEVEDVLLEARSSEPDGGLEELGTDSGVLADGVSDLVDVGSGSLADGGEGVDGGDSL
jgi:hypothetical protein